MSEMPQGVWGVWAAGTPAWSNSLDDEAPGWCFAGPDAAHGVLRFATEAEATREAERLTRRRHFRYEARLYTGATTTTAALLTIADATTCGCGCYDSASTVQKTCSRCRLRYEHTGHSEMPNDGGARRDYCSPKCAGLSDASAEELNRHSRYHVCVVCGARAPTFFAPGEGGDAALCGDHAAERAAGGFPIGRRIPTTFPEEPVIGPPRNEPVRRLARGTGVVPNAAPGRPTSILGILLQTEAAWRNDADPQEHPDHAALRRLIEILSGSVPRIHWGRDELSSDPPLAHDAKFAAAAVWTWIASLGVPGAPETLRLFVARLRTILMPVKFEPAIAEELEILFASLEGSPTT